MTDLLLEDFGSFQQHFRGSAELMGGVGILAGDAIEAVVIVCIGAEDVGQHQHEVVVAGRFRLDVAGRASAVGANWLAPAAATY